MIEIYYTNAEGQRVALDLNENQVLDIESINPLFDYELKDGSFSMPIEAPFTPKNKRNLGFPEMLESNLLNAEVYWDCEVRNNGIVVFASAKMSLLSVLSQFNYVDGIYRLVLTGPESLLGSKLSGKMMNEISFGGNVTYNTPSRQFAYDVMTGTYPALKNIISFAPVRNTAYFDTSRFDYDNELLDKDMLNGIWKSGSFSLWAFGSVSASDPNALAIPGDLGYGNYRTVPFFNLFWVIRQLFTEVGYNCDGTFFQDNRLNRLFLYNNVALESYQGKVYDLTRKIVIARHMPNISIVDFISEICALFNLEFKVVDKRVYLNFRSKPAIQNPIDLTKYVRSEFEAENTEEFLDGLRLNYEISNDGVASDRMKTIPEEAIRARFNTLAEASAFTYTPALADGDIVYIRSQNYYYIFSGEYGKFIFYSEALDPVTIGQGANERNLKATPLLKAVGVTDSGALYDLEAVEIRQLGSYISNRQIYISNPCDIRLFFITETASSAYAVKYPISTNVMPGLSLALNGEYGIYALYHQKWYNIVKTAKVVKLDIKIPSYVSISQLFDQGVKIGNYNFIIRKINKNFADDGLSSVELIKF